MLPGELHGDFSGFAETLLHLVIEFAEHHLLAVRMLIFFGHHVAQSERSHHGRGLVEDGGDIFNCFPHTRTPTTALSVVIATQISFAAFLLGPVFLFFQLKQ